MFLFKCVRPTSRRARPAFHLKSVRFMFPNARLAFQDQSARLAVQDQSVRPASSTLRHVFPTSKLQFASSARVVLWFDDPSSFRLVHNIYKVPFQCMLNLDRKLQIFYA